MEFTNFLSENSYVIVAVLWVLGVFFKAAPKMPNWLIPFLLTGIGILFGIWMYSFSLQGVLQGVLCAGGAVLCDQVLKQWERRKNK